MELRPRGRDYRCFAPRQLHPWSSGRSRVNASGVRRNQTDGTRHQTAISIADLGESVPEKASEDMHGDKTGWERPSEIAGGCWSRLWIGGASEGYEKYGSRFHGRSGGGNEAGGVGREHGVRPGEGVEFGRDTEVEPEKRGI